ncbi:hypothetical protein EBT16_12635, partial [bacterium]|nr:hypothetical protein [bacterium]
MLKSSSANRNWPEARGACSIKCKWLKSAFSAVSRIIGAHNPSIIFHLAAQPLVIESYRTPRET